MADMNRTRSSDKSPAKELRDVAAMLRSGQDQYATGYEDRYDLAIATWLESEASGVECVPPEANPAHVELLHAHAFAVARAYLHQGA